MIEQVNTIADMWWNWMWPIFWQVSVLIGFVALLDFDDANHTYTQFDLVGLMEYTAWPHQADLLDLATARNMVREYMQHRPLIPIEQQHLYDVYKLSILIDCVWYLGRGAADDFRERNKIDALTNLGRQRFFDELFC